MVAGGGFEPPIFTAGYNAPQATRKLAAILVSDVVAAGGGQHAGHPTTADLIDLLRDLDAAPSLDADEIRKRLDSLIQRSRSLRKPG